MGGGVMLYLFSVNCESETSNINYTVVGYVFSYLLQNSNVILAQLCHIQCRVELINIIGPNHCFGRRDRTNCCKQRGMNCESRKLLIVSHWSLPCMYYNCASNFFSLLSSYWVFDSFWYWFVYYVYLIFIVLFLFINELFYTYFKNAICFWWSITSSFFSYKNNGYYCLLRSYKIRMFFLFF